LAAKSIENSFYKFLEKSNFNYLLYIVFDIPVVFKTTENESKTNEFVSIESILVTGFEYLSDFIKNF
jgi:hypothetical protein